jgi:WD40 repeat protein
MYAYSFFSPLSIASPISMNASTAYIRKFARLNANQIAVASLDNLITVWDVNTHSVVNSYNAHTNMVLTIAVLPNGYLLSGGFDKNLRVWDLVANQLVNTLPVSGEVINIQWNPVLGSMVVNINGAIALYSSSTNSITATFTTGVRYWDMDVLLPSGNMIMAGAAATLDVWSVTTGIRLGSYNSTNGMTYMVKLLPDNVTAVVGYVNGYIRVFNTSGNVWGSLLLTTHTSNIRMLEVTPDLLYVISTASDNTIAMWSWSPMNLTLIKTYSTNATVNPSMIDSGTIVSSNLSSTGEANSKLALSIFFRYIYKL